MNIRLSTIKNAAGWLLSALGWIILLMSWIAAPYVTFVMYFTGGLVQTAEGFIGLDVVAIVTGLCKFVLCGIPGLMIALVGSVIGCAFLFWGDNLRW